MAEPDDRVGGQTDRVEVLKVLHATAVLEENMKAPLPRSWRVLAPAFCALFLFNADYAHGQWIGTPTWTATGSTGLVDEADTGEVTFDSVGVAFRTTAPAQSVAVIRYPISLVPVAQYTNYSAHTRVVLAMAYQRPDDWSYAVATLKRVRLADGTTSALGSVNAWDNPPSPGTQVVEKSISCQSVCFTGEYAYYVEVSLWRPYATNNPRVVALRAQAYVN